MPEPAAVARPGADLAVPTLMGGPLYELGRRLGLVAPGLRATIPLGLAIALLLWGVLMILGAAEGWLGRLLSLEVVAGHLRLLIAIPLFFSAEAVIEPHFARFVVGLRRAEIVAGASAAALRRAGERFNALVHSRLAEAVILLLAVLPVVLGFDVPLFGATAEQHGDPDASGRLATQWYWFVALPVFRFLLLRWLWRLALYYLFLWRVSQLEMRLIPIHPDRMAGLGYLAVMQVNFVSLVAAAGTVISAAIAEELFMTGGALSSYYGTILVFLLACLTIFALPLLMFSALLWETREKGLADYMELASTYVNAFDAKWRVQEARPEELLGSADLQSLADLGNSVRVVETMYLVPITVEMLTRLALWGIMPFLPLLLFEIPVDEIAKRLLEKLIG